MPERKTRQPGRPRKLKNARQLLAGLLTQPLPPGAARLGGLADWAEGGAAGGSGPPVQMYEGMLLAQMARALEGDLKALQFIRETMGERAEEKSAAQPAGDPALTEADRALLLKLAARLGVEEP